jgi:hypothetical protein
MSDDLRWLPTSDLILQMIGERALVSRVAALREELDARIPPRDRPLVTTATTPTSPAAAHSLSTVPPREVLVDQLIVMARRACKEMPGKQMRLDFEADLAALLREHGREP